MKLPNNGGMSRAAADWRCGADAKSWLRRDEGGAVWASRTPNPLINSLSSMLNRR